jgi:hypothetical protein
VRFDFAGCFDCWLPQSSPAKIVTALFTFKALRCRFKNRDGFREERPELQNIDDLSSAALRLLRVNQHLQRKKPLGQTFFTTLMIPHVIFAGP